MIISTISNISATTTKSSTLSLSTVTIPEYINSRMISKILGLIPWSSTHFWFFSHKSPVNIAWKYGLLADKIALCALKKSRRNAIANHYVSSDLTWKLLLPNLISTSQKTCRCLNKLKLVRSLSAKSKHIFSLGSLEINLLFLLIQGFWGSFFNLYNFLDILLLIK